MRRWTCVLALCVVGCSSSDEPKSTDMGGSLDAFIVKNPEDMAPPPEWVKIRITDQTPVGQGLALDAVEICSVLGMQCSPLASNASSDSALDFAGANDGPNSQDDTCTETTFTRMAGDGAWVEFSATEAGFSKDQKLNVWTGTSACPLIEAGDKAFSVSFFTADGAESDAESCTGTCTISVP